MFAPTPTACGTTISWRWTSAPDGNTLRKRKRNTTKKCHTGLDDRCRDNNGEIRQKNGATQVGTLRGIYGESFAPGVRSDMKLDTLLERTGAASLSQLLKK
jgi:hypothetical protein